ncbi:MAG: ATP-binding protein [Clostridium sp.]
MKVKGLANKLVCNFVISFTILIFILVIIMSKWINFKYYDFIKSDLEKEGQVVKEHVITHLGIKNNDEKNLRQILNILALSDNADLLLVDNIGFVYMASDGKYKNLEYTNMNFVEKQYELLKSGEPIQWKLDNDEYTYIEPIIDDGYFGGAIIFIIPIDVIQKNISILIEAIWIMAIIIIVIISIIMNRRTKKVIVDPLNNVIKVADKIAKGEVDKRVEITSNDEFGKLAESFNIMADSLDSVDKNRRDFISNVSHELRTPITSIKGFIAAILDGVVPKDKEQYYLNIVYDEIKRLARLVNDLLDVSAMESGKFNLKINEIDIISLIKICILNSQARIEAKKMTIEFIYDNDQELVLCDKDRIVQVVTNLIDNCIKYGKENGNIKIYCEVKGEKIYTSIHNDGNHLSKEEMIKIWDRFYMADKSRTQKLSTGLGLSIVRLILTQHGEDIWVNSEEGKGVTFTFTLKGI